MTKYRNSSFKKVSNRVTSYAITDDRTDQAGLPLRLPAPPRAATPSRTHPREADPLSNRVLKLRTVCYAEKPAATLWIGEASSRKPEKPSMSFKKLSSTGIRTGETPTRTLPANMITPASKKKRKKSKPRKRSSTRPHGHSRPTRKKGKPTTTPQRKSRGKSKGSRLTR